MFRRSLLCTILGALLAGGVGSMPAASLQQPAAQERQDLYGEPLPPGALARLGRLSRDEASAEDPPPYHTQTVQEVCFSPDGKLAATYGIDLSIHLWDAASGRQLLRLEDQASLPMAFSPDGKYLIYSAMLAFRQELRVWDLAKNEIVGKLPEAVDQVAFRKSDGKLIRVFNGRLSTLSLPSLEVEREPGNATAFRVVLGFSGNGEYLVSAANENVTEIDLCRVPTGETVQTFAFDRQDRTNARRLRVAFSPDNRLVACADGMRMRDGSYSIVIWETATGESLLTIPGLNRDIQDVAFSPDGRYLVSAGLGGDARIWDVTSGQEIPSQIRQAEEIKSIAFSPDGTQLATASVDCTALVWAFNPGAGELAQPAELTGERFAVLWKELASPEPNVAFAAQSEIGAQMDKAIPFIQEQIDEILQPSQTARILELIAELDSDEYMVRERATAELVRFREIALDELAVALRETRSAEVRHRINRILSMPEDAPRFASEELNRAIRLIDLLARAAGEESTALLQTIAGGFPDLRVMEAARHALQSRAIQDDPDGTNSGNGTTGG